MAKEYQGSATGGAFSPNKTLRTGDNSKENENRFASTLADYGQIQSRNDQTYIDNAAKNTKGFKDLAKFSNKLTEKLVKDQQTRNLEEYEAGIADAYLNGIPQEEAEAFDKQEAAVNAVGQETDALGAEYAEASGSRAMGERISASSGWRALGRATGMAKQGAAQYGMHMAMNANRLSEATSPEEYSAILNEVRKEYTSKFGGMNRAMMAKYMFPKMHELETQAFLGWQKQNNELIKNERVSEMGATFYAEVANGNGGQAAVDFITKNRAFLGGWGNARIKLFEIIDEGIKNGDIRSDELEAIKAQPYNFNGKNTTLGQQFARDFKNTEQKFINRTNQEFNNKENDRRIKAAEIVDKIREYQASVGRKLTDDEKKRINAEWDVRLGPLPNELKDMMTLEDVEDKAIEDRVEAKIEAGYTITEQDLEGLPLRTRQQYQNHIKGAGSVKEAEGYIKSVVNKSREEWDGDESNKSIAWQQQYSNAKAAFRRFYNQALKEGLNPTDAINSAKQQLASAVESGLVGTAIPSNNGAKVSQARATALGALEESPDLWRTTTIPGTEDTLKQLQEEIKQQANTGDTPTIPQLYHTLAAGMKGVSGWDLADQQLQLSGGTGLIKPQAEQYIDGLSDETIKGWMKYKPTPSRAVRTMAATGDHASFLDFVASPESGGDYNAFNLGGKTGFEPIGSSFGNDATGRWGKQLTQMTVGEVLDHGFSPSSEGRWVHAAGRYQIIPKTLRGLVQNYGIDTNALYDEAMQDQLALILAYQRLVAGNKINGLRSEWLGLHKYSAGAIEQSLGAAFNNPQLLLKGV